VTIDETAYANSALRAVEDAVGGAGQCGHLFRVKGCGWFRCTRSEGHEIPHATPDGPWTSPEPDGVPTLTRGGKSAQ
jgi:hypothetical protein